MFKSLRANKDCYITDRVVNSNIRATDSNVGQAGTLDLFKLYDESFLSGVTLPIELSRVLIRFDYNPLRALTASVLDITHPSFQCTLRMFDVVGGQTIPSNFKLILHPLSQSFDEGVGRDVASFSDIDATNFITASISNGSAILWNASGANHPGLLGASNIDIVSSGNIGNGSGIINLFVTQSFSDGTEHLEMNVTQLVSATLANQLPDHGFRLAFSGTHESDTRSLFVKRFASRHATNQKIVPRIDVRFNDSVRDNHTNFTFDATGTLFMNNSVRGVLRNIVSGAAATQIVGANSVRVRLVSGTFSGTFSGSQHTYGIIAASGVYSATFAIASVNALLKDEIINAGSATFSEIWESPDGTVGYFTGTLSMFSTTRTSFKNVNRGLSVSLLGIRNQHDTTEKLRVRAFIIDNDESLKVARTSFERKGKTFDIIHYRVRDAYSNEIIVPFDETYGSTLLSSDSDGMYFDMHVDAFPYGYVYAIDLLIKDAIDHLMTDVGRFKVVKTVIG